MTTAKHYIRIALNLLVPLCFLFLFVYLAPRLLIFFLPFVLGYLVAFLANPLVTLLQKKIALKRKHSSIFVSVLVLALVILLLYGMISRLISGVAGLLQDLPQYYTEFVAMIQSALGQYESLLYRLPPDLVRGILDASQNLNQTVMELLSKLATPAVSITGSAVRSVPSLFISTLIFLLSSYCFLAEWENIQRFLKTHTPEAVAGYFHSLREDVRRILGGWLLAQFKIMFVVFFVLLLGFLFLSVKYAALLAALTAFLDFLPAFGVGFVLWPWILISLLQGRFFMAAALAVIYVLTQAVRQILQPKIMGDTMGLPPLWTLFFLFVGFRLYGIAGMLFSVPVGMLFLSLYRYGLFDGFLGAASELWGDIQRLMKPPYQKKDCKPQKTEEKIQKNQ